MTLTPEQFNILATKDDVKEAILASEERITKKIDRILTAVDGIAKQHNDFKTELVANQGAHDRFEERIKGLEKKQGITQLA